MFELIILFGGIVLGVYLFSKKIEREKKEDFEDREN